jgi:hypothetical protein
MSEAINKIIIETGGKEYEFDGGGGGSITPGVPIPHDTVDSESIIDGSIQKDDLSQEVQELMGKVSVADTETADELWEGFDPIIPGEIVPGIPLPKDTVDSQSIVDGSIKPEDLSSGLKDSLTPSYDAGGEGIKLGGLNNG